MRYADQRARDVESCVYCQKSLHEQAIASTSLCVAVWNVAEPPEGGVLIIPRTHRANVFELTHEEWRQTHELLGKVRGVITMNHHPDGFNVGWNVGGTAGAKVSHAHCYVIPRWSTELHAGKGMGWYVRPRVVKVPEAEEQAEPAKVVPAGKKTPAKKPTRRTRAGITPASKVADRSR
jgi:diadenosine tetraphosphate (Ap4A) HIT family hydrolase